MPGPGSTRSARRITWRAACAAGQTVLALWIAAAPACARDLATGDWGGARTRLADVGVELRADYIGEAFVLDGDDEISYLGNLDVTATLDTEKLGWWPGGTIFLYGENKHGSLFSADLGLLMEVSNLEAEKSFTQLSEYWLEQHFGDKVVVRLGKQDANRDFAAPRFAGNFVNSSYGVLPGAPLPSFPAPGLGAAVMVDPTKWLGVRAGVYEGSPKIESFGETAFQNGGGLFAIGAVELSHEIQGREGGVGSIGGWTHTGENRSGVYGIYDLLVYAQPHEHDDPRSVQAFVRGNYSPKEPGEIGKYAGGGLTVHGYLGSHNTIGIGAGYAETDETNETFVEIFFKWRPQPWFTVEPDLQVYDTSGGRNPVFAGLRVKLKL